MTMMANGDVVADHDDYDDDDDPDPDPDDDDDDVDAALADVADVAGVAGAPRETTAKLIFLSEPVAFRRVYGLESYSRTSGRKRTPPARPTEHEDD